MDVGNGSPGEGVGEMDHGAREVEGKRGEEGDEGDGEEDEEAGALDDEELGSVGAAVEADLRGSGVVDGKQLGSERRGAREAAVVVAEHNE